MTAEVLFYIIIGIIALNFLIDKILDNLNARRFGDAVPTELEDVYDQAEYKRSQEYKYTNYRFGILTTSFSFMLTLAFFFLDGFEIVDNIARSYTEHPILVAMIFFGIIMLASDILTTPFAYYKTFVIEERFGFNKTTHKTFFLDKIKGWLMMIILGGGLLAGIIWFYTQTGKNFWLYAWGLITLVTIFMNLFYSRLIVPLFNKQTPPGRRFIAFKNCRLCTIGRLSAQQDFCYRWFEA